MRSGGGVVVPSQPIAIEDKMRPLKAERQVVLLHVADHAADPVGQMNVIISPCEKHVACGKRGCDIPLGPQIGRTFIQVDHLDSWMLEEQPLWLEVVADDEFGFALVVLSQKALDGLLKQVRPRECGAETRYLGEAHGAAVVVVVGGSVVVVLDGVEVVELDDELELVEVVVDGVVLVEVLDVLVEVVLVEVVLVDVDVEVEVEVLVEVVVGGGVVVVSISSSYGSMESILTPLM